MMCEPQELLKGLMSSLMSRVDSSLGLFIFGALGNGQRWYHHGESAGDAYGRSFEGEASGHDAAALRELFAHREDFAERHWKVGGAHLRAAAL